MLLTKKPARLTALILALSLFFPFASGIRASGMTGGENKEAEEASETPALDAVTGLLLPREEWKLLSVGIENYDKGELRLNTYEVAREGKSIGTLSYEVLQFENGDIYFYLSYESKASHELSAYLPIMFDTFDLHRISYPEGLDETTSVMEARLNINSQSKLPKGGVFLDSDKLNAFFSYSSCYKKYKNGVVQELWDKASALELTEDGVKIRLAGEKGTTSEFWGLMSKEKLVDWSNKAVVTDLRISDLNRVRKWRQDGIYYVLPTTYSPYVKSGFYRNNAQHIGEKYLRVNGGRFFEDFGYMALQVAKRTQNEDGYWGTQPLSQWIYKDYGIGAGFFDTRFDTEGALFLLKGYKKYGEQAFLDGAVSFGDYYVKHALSNSAKTKNGGLLVYDYGSESTAGRVNHVSLNHQLCGMNYLYELYQVTGDETYLSTANRLLKAVEDTMASWVRKDNGDLHYAYLKNGKYGMKDYPELTLNDLKLSQEFVSDILGEENKALAYLINKKETYLRSLPR